MWRSFARGILLCKANSLKITCCYSTRTCTGISWAPLRLCKVWFKKTCCKIWLESGWNTVFSVASKRTIFGSNGTLENVALFHRRKRFPSEIRVSYFKTHLWYQFQAFATFFRLPVLNFSYHLSKPWIDRFAHIKGKQSMSSFYFHWTIYCTMIDQDQEFRVHCDNQLRMFEIPSAQWYQYSLIKSLSFKFLRTLLRQKINSIFDILVRI